MYLRKNVCVMKLTIISFFFIFLTTGCEYIIYFEALDSASQYKIYGKLYGIETKYDKESKLVLFINVDSSNYNKQIIDKHESIEKQAILYLGDNDTLLTEIQWGSSRAKYLASFILDDNYPDFNAYDNVYHVDLIFGNKDSIINRYRYKKN